MTKAKGKIYSQILQNQRKIALLESDSSTLSQSELWEMDEKSLEEELQALLSDKSGEAEYVQSLQLQIMRVKEISHIVRCSCGEEYNVKLDK
ncbi:UNVERIFIED_CONTAM: hypothetical protein Sradi_5214100 [Sesamum radiatum]|uniref:DksA C4-type domain-containing protein n=1 Tax=Sesamum radiatum TaxID=300843 RepID=A0AAW2M602_SESRA